MGEYDMHTYLLVMTTFYMEKWRLLPAAGIKFVQYIKLQPTTITLIGRSSESHKVFEPY